VSNAAKQLSDKQVNETMRYKTMHLRSNSNILTYLPLLLLLSLPSFLATVNAAHPPKNAILLSTVQSLTLRTNKQTTHRRVPSIPQLKCISPRALCALAPIDTMRCVNQGSSYRAGDVEWACTANLPSTVRLGSTDVICEGYASSEDEYVLRGSCGVEYRVVLTEEGERRYPELAGTSSSSGWTWGGGEGDGETDWAGYIFAVIFFAVVVWIVYSACVRADENRRAAPGGQGRRRWGGGGPGGGWGGGWGPGGGGDPPPPYPGTKPNTDESWRPGFWTGLASGAAAGYMAGNRRDRQEERYNRGGGGFWGSGSGSNGDSSSWRSGSRSSGSGTQHESTGFGSTSRR